MVELTKWTFCSICAVLKVEQSRTVTNMIELNNNHFVLTVQYIVSSKVKLTRSVSKNMFMHLSLSYHTRRKEYFGVFWGPRVNFSQSCTIWVLFLRRTLTGVSLSNFSTTPLSFLFPPLLNYYYYYILKEIKSLGEIKTGKILQPPLCLLLIEWPILCNKPTQLPTKAPKKMFISYIITKPSIN